MKYTRVLGGFSDMRDAELLNRANAALEAIAASPTLFVDPIPPLATVQAATDDYRLKLALASQTKGLQDVSLKKEAKEVLADLLQKLAFYVNTVANGHLPTLYASGMPVTTPRIVGLFPSIPQRLRATDGPVSGSVRFDFNKVFGSSMAYNYSYAVTETEEEAPDWNDPLYSRSSQHIAINGLPRRAFVHIRVRAVNANGTSDWCDPIRHLVR